MAHTFYAQSNRPEPTMTVGQLIERLQAFDPSSPVVFRAPLYGAFGANTAYTIEAIDVVAMERRELNIPGGTATDEETGEEYTYESHTQVFNAWSGVVIT